VADLDVRRTRPWLGLILVLAFVLRFWGIGFGLPNEAARPDERHLIGYTLTMGGNHLNPGFFNYPSLYLYLLLVAYGAYFAGGRLAGHFATVRDLAAEYALAPTPLYLIDRCLVALLGVATVYLTYLIGARWLGKRGGLLSALFLSVAYLHVRESHLGTVDVPLTFFATLATWQIVRADQTHTTRSHVLAGLLVGLAISTKYNGAALLVPLGLLALLPSGDGRDHGQRGKRALLSTGGVIVGFFAGTPFALLDHKTFLRDAAFELVHKAQEVPTPDLGRGWVYHLVHSLPGGLGLPLFLAALVGIALGLRERRRTTLLVLGFPVAWWLGVGASKYVYLRYAVPLAPSFCLFAAAALEAGFRRWRSATVATPALRVSLATAVVLGLVAVPLWRSMQWDRLVRRTDTRVLASRWIEAHVPAGERLGVVGPEYIWPQLWNSPAQLGRYLESTGAQRSQGRRLRAEIRRAHVLGAGLPSYEMETLEGGAWMDTLVIKEAEGSGLPVVRPGTRDQAIPPAWVVLAAHPAWSPPPGTVPELGPAYTLAASFTGASNPNEPRFYDRQDAFYFPYLGFAGIDRPGPELRIYHRSP
jgi:hypothetical protein